MRMGTSLAYKNPRHIITPKPIFWRLGICSLEIILMGNVYVKKSVEMFTAALAR